MVCVVALGPLPASQGHSWDNGHSGHRKEICPVAEERGLSAPHPRLLSAGISLTRKSPEQRCTEWRGPVAGCSCARRQKHCEAVAKTQSRCRSSALDRTQRTAGAPWESTFRTALLSFFGRSPGMGVGGCGQLGFFLFFSAAFTGHQENLLEQGPGPLRQRRAGLVPPGARLSH